MNEEKIIENYMKQIDINKVRTAIDTVNFIGLNSLVVFNTRIDTNSFNSMVEINISNKLGEWEFIVTYNGNVMWNLTFALRRVADIVFEGLYHDE